MFEHHGWATLRTDAVDEYGDPDEAAQQQLLTNLRQYIKTLRINSAVYIEWRNCSYALSIYGNSSHRNEDVIDLFRWLAENARGSYGLLYVHDDEDMKRGQDYSNHFRVWKLALGQLQELDDPFLSPYFPTVEILGEE